MHSALRPNRWPVTLLPYFPVSTAMACHTTAVLPQKQPQKPGATRPFLQRPRLTITALRTVQCDIIHGHLLSA